MINHQPLDDSALLGMLNGTSTSGNVQIEASLIPTVSTAEKSQSVIPTSDIDFSFRNYFNKSKEGDDMKQLFGNFIYLGDLAFLAGRTGLGKSILSYTLCDGVSRGADVLGQKNECEPQKVLLYDLELGLRNIKARFRNYEPHDNFLRPDCEQIFLQTDGKLDFEIIEQHVIATGAKVIVLDNISFLSVKSLQDQDASLKLIKEAKLLKSKHDLTIILVAHTPKIRENRELSVYDISGSANLLNFLDSAVMLNRSSQDVHYRYIKSVKNRNGDDMEKIIVCEINNVDWLHLEYVGMELEKNHLQIDNDKQNEKKQKLVEIAENVIGNGSIRYNDFCNEYATQYQKTYENGKKIISQLLNNDIIVKADDGKYLINRNEINF